MEIEKLKEILRKKQTPAEFEPPVEAMRKSMEKLAFPAADDIRSEKVSVTGIEGEWVRAPASRSERAILYLHGGGYVIGSCNTHRALAGEIARESEASVLLINYRMGPEHPFPAAVDDSVVAFEWLLNNGYKGTDIALAGDSAGGGLALATLVASRDRGLEIPASGVAISPWADLTCSNEAYQSKAADDPMVTPHGLRRMAGLYLGEGNAEHPYASPNLAELAGLPPLLLHVGSDEILLDDAVAFEKKARAAGVDCELEVWDDMIHVWHAFHPILDEGKAGIQRIGEFLVSKWGSA